MQPAMVHQQILDERRERGLDGRDEVWDGVVHMVPSASRVHVLIQGQLLTALVEIARRRGLLALIDFDLMDPEKGEQDYRQPDITVVEPERTTQRATQPGAHLVVEIRSPHDESRDKIPFYVRQQVREIWLVDPRTYTLEVFAADSSAATPIVAIDGIVHSHSLGLELQIVGDALVIRDGEHEYSVDLRDVP